jgi:hypothetical protein
MSLVDNEELLTILSDCLVLSKRWPVAHPIMLYKLMFDFVKIEWFE